MKNKFFLVAALVWVAQFSIAQIAPSVTLTTYYATANGQSGNDLRLALFDIIKGHTQIGYKQLGPIMQWSDTENADGIHVYDIYTNCTFTCSGPITWSNTSSVGGGMNREHTVPQSWFSEQEPMKSDVFHVYPTDCKANGNRSSYLYGEFTGAGTSYSSSSCAETGKLSIGTDNSIAPYTYNNQTYAPTETWSAKVYEPIDEYKGDLARSYFYMATRYADACASWSGGAFGSDNNGLDDYTAELMLKWHRLDPVSEKELIRNEVIYGNPTYNQSDKKQGNRNPFIDFPELVEYIWGDKQTVPVSVTALETMYAVEGSGVDETLDPARVVRKIVRDGQVLIQVGDQLYNLQGQQL